MAGEIGINKNWAWLWLLVSAQVNGTVSVRLGIHHALANLKQETKLYFRAAAACQYMEMAIKRPAILFVCIIALTWG